MTLEPFRQHFSRTAYRTALPVALMATALSAFQAWLWSDLTAIGISVVSLGFGLIIFVVTYSLHYLIHFHRLQFINRVTRDIYRKQFEDYSELPARDKDEIDHLLRQAVKASETIEREISRLNKIENYRKEFIGDISHELKTPVFAIQGFIETLLNGALEDPMVNKKFLEKAMGNVNRLINLIKDLMDISRLESGERKPRPVNFSLRELIGEAVESVQYKAQKEDVEIRLKEFDKNLIVYADIDQIRQVCINLIENGIKYNRAGGWVEIGLQAFPKKSDKILLYVKDSGIGIDPAYLNRVTERFFRADKSRSREKGGTGLGLSIVKHIMQSHGENLYIESQPGKGSLFSITLPRPGGVVISPEEEQVDYHLTQNKKSTQGS